MYTAVMFITLIHLFSLTIWIIYKKIQLEIKINNNNEEFTYCKLPKSIIINNFLNFSVIAASSLLSYFIRNVKKEFKENLSMPVYIYFVVNILVFITDQENEISIKVKDLIQSMGSIL
ncbi:hypothetical protein BCR36DRAFT_246714, partial [Piromyces finnis]